MKVETVAEQLLFVTVNLAGATGKQGTTGTGFIYGVETEKGTAHFLVTNKHVLDGVADRLRIQMVAARSDGGPAFGKAATIDLTGVPAGRSDHPDADVDVAVLPFGDVINGMRKHGQAPFFRATSGDHLLNDQDVEDLIDAVEEVVFVGYPDNIFDTHNFTPIMRTGITATPIALDFAGKPQFLIDASVFPGSSGSPVFLLDRGGSYRSKDGTTAIGARFALLGVLHAMRVRHVEADVVQIPTRVGVRLADPLNLGVVFKATTIEECIDPVLAASGLVRKAGPITQSSTTTEADEVVEEATG
jgi:hypothetical protein